MAPVSGSGFWSVCTRLYIVNKVELKGLYVYCGTLPRTKNTTSNMTGPREQLLSGQGRGDSGLDRDTVDTLEHQCRQYKSNPIWNTKPVELTDVLASVDVEYQTSFRDATVTVPSYLSEKTAESYSI